MPVRISEEDGNIVKARVTGRLVKEDLEHSLPEVVDYEGVLTLVDPPDGLELPERIRFEPEHRGLRNVSGRASEPGVYRLRGASDSAPSDSSRSASSPSASGCSAAARLISWSLRQRSTTATSSLSPTGLTR